MTENARALCELVVYRAIWLLHPGVWQKTVSRLAFVPGRSRRLRLSPLIHA